MVKNGRGLLDHGTLKSAVSAANVNLVINGWAWSKMGKTFRSYGTLKSGASHI